MAVDLSSFRTDSNELRYELLDLWHFTLETEDGLTQQAGWACGSYGRWESSEQAQAEGSLEAVIIVIPGTSRPLYQMLMAIDKPLFTRHLRAGI